MDDPTDQASGLDARHSEVFLKSGWVVDGCHLRDNGEYRDASECPLRGRHNGMMTEAISAEDEEKSKIIS